MSYNAKVYRVLIASPSDVTEEREIIANVIQQWNDLYSYEKKVVLLPLRWETHSAPQMGMRPQEIINREVVEYCDFAVGVFWTRIGSYTGEYASGTIEEIELVGNSEKIVMLYFSNAKVDLESVDLVQYQKLKDFKKKTYPKALVETYKNIVEFRDKFSKQLEIKLRQVIMHAQGNDNLESFDNLPQIEVGFVDVKTKNKSIDKLDLQIPVTDVNFEQVWAEMQKFGLKDDYTQLSETFYAEIQSKYSQKFSSYLKNISTVGIRDIYIEFRTKKNSGFYLTNSIEGFDRMRFIGTQIISSTLILEETDDEYIFYISYTALQPQRTVILSNYLNIYANAPAEYIFNYKIFADCFPIPVSNKLRMNVETMKVDFDIREFLKQKGLLLTGEYLSDAEFEEVK